LFSSVSQYTDFGNALKEQINRKTQCFVCFLTNLLQYSKPTDNEKKYAEMRKFQANSTFSKAQGSPGQRSELSSNLHFILYSQG